MKGISGTFRGLKFQANFIVYIAGAGKQIVKCMLEVKESTPYQGIRINTNFKCTALAKCNTDAGDIFSLKKGQKIALRKALVKFKATSMKMEKIFKSIQKRIILSAIDFYEKVEREAEKGKCINMKGLPGLDKEIKLKLKDAEEYCDTHDKSTEFMIQYMQDMTGLDHDTIIQYLKED
jgi:hypothetical protein